MPNEYTEVEQPFFTRLKDVGYGHLVGDEHDPAVTGRSSFREVLIEGRVRDAIARLNGQLSPDQQEAVYRRLERLNGHRTLEANEEAHKLLTGGAAVSVPGSARAELARYIDFENPQNNDFLVVNQFKVEGPGGKSIKPDLVLFVNGVPLVVVEAKSPATEEPIHHAIEQMLRYQNARGGEHEGAERLFHYNLLTVATSFDKVRVGTVGARHAHYQPWKDPYPLSVSELQTRLGKIPSEQEILIFSLLTPALLLDVLENFTLFSDSERKRVKIVPRYPQLRAVYKVAAALQKPRGATPPGLPDDRSGIVWHTQGSGKSFTMTYLIRKMRSMPSLRDFKVVIVTDRRDLERQIKEAAILVGDALETARTVRNLKGLLEKPGAGLVLGMIQKFQNPLEESVEAAQLPDALNSSEKVLLIVDEAHRSHAKDLHARMMAALPFAAKVGFTGTPIFRADKKRSAEIFGPTLDSYTLAESQADGSTVKIKYEGRTAPGVLSGGEGINTLFDNLFRNNTEEEKERIRKRYGNYRDIAEAPKLIKEKARNMLRHYIQHILPGGFKAQLVAVSRIAAVRYQAALLEARDELTAALETQGDVLELLDLSDESLDAETRFLMLAWPHLDTIRKLEFAAIISHAHNDEEALEAWSDPARQEVQIERFKKPLGEDPLAFLVVNAMLLTGFSASVEQVMYLDRPLRDHDLLQAIARVNRPMEGKGYGLVVDYYGVAHHLTEALEAYGSADVAGVLTDWRDDLPRLQSAHAAVVQLFKVQNLALTDTEGCALSLSDERRRAEFSVAVREFAEAMDAVLPRPDALPFVSTLKAVGFIGKRAGNLFRDDALDLPDARKKVRLLIDRFVEAGAPSLLVAPLELLTDEFDAYVKTLPSSRSKAAEMEHAARHHISVHLEEDPVYFTQLKSKLEAALEAHAGHWDAQVDALTQFLEAVRHGAREAVMGLEPRRELPFFRALLARQGAEPDAARKLEVVAHTRQLVAQLSTRIRVVDFWRKEEAQRRLRAELMGELLKRKLIDSAHMTAATDDLMQLARVLHARLIA